MFFDIDIIYVACDSMSNIFQWMTSIPKNGVNVWSLENRVQYHIGDDDGYSYGIKHIYTDDLKPKSDVIKVTYVELDDITEQTDVSHVEPNAVTDRTDESNVEPNDIT
jgi:hypothetical protein